MKVVVVVSSCEMGTAHHKEKDDEDDKKPPGIAVLKDGRHEISLQRRLPRGWLIEVKVARCYGRDRARCSCCLRQP